MKNWKSVVKIMPNEMCRYLFWIDIIVNDFENNLNIDAGTFKNT